MKSYLLHAFLFFSIFSFGQEKILYIVDGVPIIEESHLDNTLTDSDIAETRALKDRDKIVKLGYSDFDAVYYVSTKEYIARPDSLKSIPTTKLMTKINNTWHLKGSDQPYTGRFIDYYMNGQQKGSGYFLNGKIDGLRKLYYADGKLSDEITYKSGVSHGLEQRYHKNGNLSQKGNFEYGKEVGIWESYHVNGTLKQRSNYDRGTLNGKAESFYSTGTLRSAENYINGVPSDKKNKKLGEKYNQGIAADRQADFKLSIKKYTECLEIEPSFAAAFYARGTAKLNDLDFDGALQDFNKALEIEPSFMQVYGNRAFALLRKHEFKNSRKINTDKDFTVLAVTSTAIPAADLEKICFDLAKSIELGDTTQMTKDAHEKYCKSK